LLKSLLARKSGEQKPAANSLPIRRACFGSPHLLQRTGSAMQGHPCHAPAKGGRGEQSHAAPLPCVDRGLDGERLECQSSTNATETATRWSSSKNLQQPPGFPGSFACLQMPVPSLVGPRENSEGGHEGPRKRGRPGESWKGGHRERQRRRVSQADDDLAQSPDQEAPRPRQHGSCTKACEVRIFVLRIEP
jgi:hypothetical protein